MIRTYRVEKIEEILKALNGLDERFWKLVFLTSPLKSLEILDELVGLHKDLDKIFAMVADLKERG